MKLDHIDKKLISLDKLNSLVKSSRNSKLLKSLEIPILASI